MKNYLEEIEEFSPLREFAELVLGENALHLKFLNDMFRLSHSRKENQGKPAYLYARVD